GLGRPATAFSDVVPLGSQGHVLACDPEQAGTLVWGPEAVPGATGRTRRPGRFSPPQVGSRSVPRERSAGHPATEPDATPARCQRTSHPTRTKPARGLGGRVVTTQSGQFPTPREDETGRARQGRPTPRGSREARVEWRSVHVAGDFAATDPSPAPPR